METLITVAARRSALPGMGTRCGGIGVMVGVSTLVRCRQEGVNSMARLGRRQGLGKVTAGLTRAGAAVLVKTPAVIGTAGGRRS